MRESWFKFALVNSRKTKKKAAEKCNPPLFGLYRRRIHGKRLKHSLNHSDAGDGKRNDQDIIQNGAPLRDGIAVLRAFANVVGLLRVDARRACDELNRDWTASQELADILMHRFGVPFRLGHRTASRMVTLARERNWTPLSFQHAEACRLYAEVIVEAGDRDVPQRFPLSEKEFRDALDPAEIVKHRATAGGPQPSELARQFADARAGLEDDAQWLAQKRAQLSAAEAQTDAAIEALARR